MKRESLQNLAVLLISLGGAAYCADLLYLDFNSRSSANGHSPAGTLADKTQTVKRKYGDNLLWEPVDVSDTLYWNDAVQTADHASASITLDDGNKIMLGESSLVVLEHDNEKLSLFLKSGQLLVDSSHAKARASTIKVNGMAMEEKQGAKLSLAMDETKHEVMAVQSQTDGTAHEMKIDKQGNVQEMELPAILSDPAPLIHIYSETQSASVPFKWQAADGRRQVLELAKDRDFKNVVSKKDGVQNQAQIPLQPGMYYWHVIVSGTDGKQASSEVRSFDIIQTTKPILTSLEKTPVAFHGEAPVVEFNWQGNPLASKYLWELSDTQDFQNLVSSGETTATSYRTSQIKEGHLYWRVSAVYGERSIASVPSTLEIKKLADPIPAGDLLPAPEFTFSYEDFEKSEGLPFHWKPAPNETYRFVFSKNADLKNELAGFETTQDGTLLKDKYDAGTYYWSVGYKGDDGNWVYPEIRKVAVGPLIPFLTPPQILGSNKSSELNLLKDPVVKWNWKGVDGASGYHFKLLKISGEKQETVLDEVVKSNKKEKNDLPDGQYKWMVSAVDKYGRESKNTPVDFTVIHGKALAAPDFDMQGVQ